VTEPLLRVGGELRPVGWDRALEQAAAILGRAGERTAALVGGQATSEEGFLLARLLREGLGSPDIDSRHAGTVSLEHHRALNDPRLQARVSDLEFAHSVLVLACDPIADAPILDLRLRKGARRHGVKLVHAGVDDLRERSQELIAKLKQAGETVVVLWHERLTAGPDGTAAVDALLALANALALGGIDGAGMLEIPAQANGRGLREAGALPNAGPGLSAMADVPLRTLGVTDTTQELTAGEEGRDAGAIAQGLLDGDLSALVLAQWDPLADPSDREVWEQALSRADAVIAHAAFLTDGLNAHADVVLPAESYAEKEGTIVHPDGRIQRLRPAVAHPGSVRSGWRVLAELAAGIDLDLQVSSGAMASQQLFDSVSFYAGLTLEQIGGRGIRWQERPQASPNGGDLARSSSASPPAVTGHEGGA
jgi:NADH-quinone oxidoreductase subunit G